MKAKQLKSLQVVWVVSEEEGGEVRGIVPYSQLVEWANVFREGRLLMYESRPAKTVKQAINMLKKANLRVQTHTMVKVV